MIRGFKSLFGIIFILALLLAFPVISLAAPVISIKNSHAKTFQEFIGRAPTAQELQTAAKKYPKLNKYKKFINQSPDRQKVISNLYLENLCREPRKDEVAFFVKRTLGFGKIQQFVQTHKENCVAKKPKAVVVNPTVDVPAEATEITLDATPSFDPQGGALNYRWQFQSGPGQGVIVGDGGPLAAFSLPADSSFNDYYAKAGEYVIRLTVTSGVSNYSSNADMKINVSPYTTFEVMMLDRVNSLRESLDLNKLELVEKLTAAARKYSYYMRENDWFDHLDKNNENFDKRIAAEKYDFRVVGENILVVKSDKNDLVLSEESMDFFYQGWKDSPKHYANMVHEEFKQVGIGFSVGPSPDGELPFAHYGSQEFGTLKRSAQKVTKTAGKTVK